MCGDEHYDAHRTGAEKAIAELERIFMPMLKEVINSDHHMASSTATMLELA